MHDYRINPHIFISILFFYPTDRSDERATDKLYHIHFLVKCNQIINLNCLLILIHFNTILVKCNQVKMAACRDGLKYFNTILLPYGQKRCHCLQQCHFLVKCNQMMVQQHALHGQYFNTILVKCNQMKTIKSFRRYQNFNTILVKCNPLLGIGTLPF